MTAGTTRYATCPLCEASCGLEIELGAGGVVSRIRGNPDDVFSRGHICPKAVALQDLHSDPDRLRVPLRRTPAGDFEEISWEVALEEAATRLREVQRAHGRHAVASYIGNPSVHDYGTLLFGVLLLKRLRSRNRYSANSTDALPQLFVSHQMYGHQALLPVPDLDRTHFLLVLGANPAVSNGSVMTAPDAAGRLRAIRERGGRVVVVDPRRSETAALADQHLFIRPGGDAWLLAAMLHVLFAEGRAAPGRLAAHTDGIDALARLVAECTPEAAAGPTGIAPEAIRALARDFAAAPSAVAYGRMGVSVQRNGALCAWLIQCLNLVTGNLDRPGGAMITTPAVDALAVAALTGQKGWYAPSRSRVSGLPGFGGELPVAALAEEIETPGEGQVRALVTVAGNPVLSAPNGPRLERALERLDFMVAIDCYRNETTRHAHLILPPTSPLERDHYDLVFATLAVRNYARYNDPVLPRAPGSRHDWEILLELATRLRRPRGFGAVERATLGRIGPRGLLDLALLAGPHGLRAWPRRRPLTIEALRRAPNGVDLGPLEPRLPGRLYTPGRRVRLCPEPLVADLARLRAEAAAPAEGEELGLRLIGRRSLRSNNSWMHNSLRLVKGPPRCTLLMHPGDAGARGLSAGQRVRVRSRTGAVEVPLELSDEVMPGVVSLPHGWGHHREGARLRVAAAHAGVSHNDLTDETRIDPVIGTAAFSGTPVEVEAA